MSVTPLGDDSEFHQFSGVPKAWGPERNWRVWFAGKVVDGLCEILDEHLAVPRMSGVRWPAAIGCVPWLGSRDVSQRLQQMRSCVVVDKNELRIVPRELVNSNRGIPNTALNMGRYRPEGIPDDEEDLVARGEEDRYEYYLGPIRLYGWTEQPQVSKPILHTKLLVSCDSVLFTWRCCRRVA